MKTTTWVVRWVTVAGNGSRSFGTEAEARGWMAELEQHGIRGAWLYVATEE